MKLLIASNQPSLFQWIGTVLDRHDSAVLTSLPQLLDQFKSNRYDSVIIDIDDAEQDIQSMIAGIRAIATRRWIPIIILTSEMDEEKLSSMFNAGADDIILSSYPSWLLKAKLCALGRVEQIQSELQVASDRIEQLSLVDPLTQLPNSRGVMNEAVRLFGQSHRDEKPFAAVMIQLDYFSQYLKEHGHQQAQELFHTIALLVEGSSCRPLDFVGRYDDNVLILLLPETDTLGAQKVASDVLRHVREAALPYASSPNDGIVTVTVATDAYNPGEDQMSVDHMLNTLRRGLEAAQSSGHDQSIAM